MILRALGLRPPGGEVDVYSEAELKMLLSRSTEEGELEAQEQEMLYKVFDFADKEVSTVMVPRPEVVALSIDLPPEEALAAVIESPYTRYPVYRETLDKVVGILHVRDLFSALVDRGIAGVQLEQLLRPAYIVPETKDLAALLAEFRKTNQHMAIVVDEYGDLEGIVTLEDLLEEIVGEIEDEFDLPDESIEQLENGCLRIHGTFPIDDFNEQFAPLAADRGLPHDRRLRLRPPGPRSGARATRSSRRHPVQGARGRGLADRAARGRAAPPGARRAPARRSLLGRYPRRRTGSTTCEEIR